MPQESARWRRRTLVAVARLSIRISNLVRLSRLRGLPWLLGALAAYAAVRQLSPSLAQIGWTVALLCWLGANFRVRGSILAAVGAASNLAVVLVNRGQMPVYGMDVSDAMHATATGQTHLGLLADIIPSPLEPYSVVSLGDLCIVAGVIWLVLAMVIRPSGELPLG